MQITYLFILLLLSALFSGLTIGLMGLDLQTLKRKADLGDKQASTVYRVRKHANWMLTTLLLGNAAVNSTASIILGSMFSGAIAGVIATIAIFIFGEVLPQSVFSRHGLRFGAKTAWLVTFLMYITYPLTKFLAWCLDKLLGEEKPTRFSRPELLKFINEHGSSGMLDGDEQDFATGALTFSHKKVVDVMTPNVAVMMLEVHEVLDAKYIEEIKNSGFSRFPVYEKNHNNIVGMFYIRDLVGVAGREVEVKELTDNFVLFVNQNDMLDSVLNRMKIEKVHLAVVIDEFGGFEGVISKEDIFEEIIGYEIVDEFDQHENMRQHAKEKYLNKK